MITMSNTDSGARKHNAKFNGTVSADAFVIKFTQ